MVAKIAAVRLSILHRIIPRLVLTTAPTHFLMPHLFFHFPKHLGSFAFVSCISCYRCCQLRNLYSYLFNPICLNSPPNVYPPHHSLGNILFQSLRFDSIISADRSAFGRALSADCQFRFGALFLSLLLLLSLESMVPRPPSF